MRHYFYYTCCLFLATPLLGFGAVSEAPTVSKKVFWEAITDRYIAALKDKKYRQSTSRLLKIVAPLLLLLLNQKI